jgi:hypothetical protein
MSSKPNEHPLLIAQTGPLKGQRFTVDRPIIIGRESSCEVVIPDRQVSRFHARLSLMPEGVMIEDLGSKNGTHCNGNLINGPMMLQDGDIVQIAVAQQFIFLTSDATMPLTEELPRRGRLRLEMRSRRVWINNQALDPPLSALQFHVLRVLYEKEGQVVERQDLVSEAWGDEQSVGVSDQALDALIRRLRDRLTSLDSSHIYITTVRGHGIRLDNPPVE